VARSMPLVTVEQAQTDIKQRVDDYHDFIKHVASALCTMHEEMSYGAQDHYFNDWPDPDSVYSTYIAIAIAGTSALRREQNISANHLKPEGHISAFNVADWIVYHPLSSMILREAYALIGHVWQIIDENNLTAEYEIYCRSCGGFDHLCY